MFFLLTAISIDSTMRYPEKYIPLGVMRTLCAATFIFALLFGFLFLLSEDSRAKKGLRLAVILGVVLLVLAVGWTVFSRLGGGIQRSEAGPIAHLRTISSGEELYYARNGEYASLSDLYTSGQYIDQSLSIAVDLESAKTGYYFTLNLAKDGQSWCCVMRPAEWGKDGTRNFFLDQIGAIYYNTEENSSEFVKQLGRD